VIALERVPVAPGVARVAAAAGRDPAELAATGGEDFALLVAGSPALVDGSGLIRVGALERGAPGVVLTRGGSPVALPRLGWEH
jgi:thiamine-monophosphate kinase